MAPSGVCKISRSFAGSTPVTVIVTGDHPIVIVPAPMVVAIGLAVSDSAG